MSDVPTLTGATVRDERGQKIGSVTNVYFDDTLEKPLYAAIKLGMISRKHHLIPLRGTYRSADEDLVVPYDKSLIASSPVDDSGVAPTQTDASAINRHFDVDHVLDVGTERAL